MNIILKIFFRIILVLLLLAVLAVGFVWGFVYFKCKVNIFSVLSSVGQLNSAVEVSTIAPKQITSADTESAVEIANSSVVGLFTKDAGNENYHLNDSALPVMLSDMQFSDKQVCAIMNILMNGSDLEINFGGTTINLKEYGFELLQIAFSDLNTDENSVKFNVVASISLTKFTQQMTSFPLSLVKSRVPEKVYLSSTVIVTKNSGAFNYSVESESLVVNTLAKDKVDEIFTLLDAFLKTGTSDQLNKTIGENFVNALIGNSENTGFAYTLSEIGASDFAFVNVSDEIKFVIQK